MRTCEPGITVNKGKEGIEVPYIVHTLFFCADGNKMAAKFYGLCCTFCRYCWDKIMQKPF